MYHLVGDYHIFQSHKIVDVSAYSQLKYAHQTYVCSYRMGHMSAVCLSIQYIFHESNILVLIIDFYLK